MDDTERTPSRPAILLADDEESLRRALSMILEAAGFRCLVASDGVQAIDIVARDKPDLAVLDVMMPKLDGFEAIERIRAIDPEIPILMLSAKADIVDKKVGFRLGADDYMAKPFNEEEFLLRIQALLRRREQRTPTAERETASKTAQSTSLVIGDLEIDLLHRHASIRGTQVALTPKEFDILAVLASQPGRTFTPAELISCIWGPDFVDGAISIPVYIRRLRKKIEINPSEPDYLQTIHQIGYRLIPK